MYLLDFDDLNSLSNVIYYFDNFLLLNNLICMNEYNSKFLKLKILEGFLFQNVDLK